MNSASVRIRSAPQASPVRSRCFESLDLRFIPSPEFTELTLEQLLAEAPTELIQPHTSSGESPSGCTGLLTPAGERHLFRLLNFLKSQASRLRNQIWRKSTPARIEQFESLWRDIQQTRDQLAASNLRLVWSLAYKYAPTIEEVEEFVSEGNLILINAIDKFDYFKGYRFSTYATHAVQRHFFRVLQRRTRQSQLEFLSTTDHLESISVPETEESLFSPHAAAELIGRFDECLNEREKEILQHRFGLQGKTAQTLKSIAGRVGLSKERVRQIQLAALAKLRDLAIRLQLQPEISLSPDAPLLR